MLTNASGPDYASALICAYKRPTPRAAIALPRAGRFPSRLGLRYPRRAAKPGVGLQAVPTLS